MQERHDSEVAKIQKTTIVLQLAQSDASVDLSKASEKSSVVEEVRIELEEENHGLSISIKEKNDLLQANTIELVENSPKVDTVHTELQEKTTEFKGLRLELENSHEDMEKLDS